MTLLVTSTATVLSWWNLQLLVTLVNNKGFLQGINTDISDQRLLSTYSEHFPDMQEISNQTAEKVLAVTVLFNFMMKTARKEWCNTEISHQRWKSVNVKFCSPNFLSL